jgi:hypothetical protein
MTDWPADITPTSEYEAAVDYVLEGDGQHLRNWQGGYG